ncbi:hypothetical protein EVAR_29936_1 [Eumeta japonica]|uniref:Uncharacterized protein n=1 Tax=Eumeta variegata TaxID=151549 RepID=A0A4C1VJ60_EUMVA|nr:hypothetical protein EVAR_29936_1 [Eumeta japonica]
MLLGPLNDLQSRMDPAFESRGSHIPGSVWTSCNSITTAKERPSPGGHDRHDHQPLHPPQLSTDARHDGTLTFVLAPFCEGDSAREKADVPVMRNI